MAYDTATVPFLRPGIECAQSPEDLAPCVRETLMMSGAVQALETLLGELETRLYQVLVPDEPRPDSVTAARAVPVMSPLHDALSGVNDRIGHLERRLIAVMARLTI